MQLHWIDWSVILVYLIFSLIVSLYFSKRASKNITEYFVSGRSLPWWLLGTSMVATSFASDTPLAVSGLVATRGIAGNWYWWCTIPGFVLVALFIAQLWRRTNILTAAEFAEFRYSGPSARFLRGFRAVYFGLIVNAIITGWVTRAMVKVLSLSLGWGAEYEWTLIWILFAITVGYTLLSGLWGVVMTDFVQFIFAMAGAILLAIFCLVKFGGMSSIISQLHDLYGTSRVHDTLAIVPGFKDTLEPFSAFMIYMFIQWWSSGSTDAGGDMSQRLLAAKDEKHAMLSVIWFNIAHFCLRPWPWIIVGLVALVKFPYLPNAAGVLPDAEGGYPKMMLVLLPMGLKGLMIASFFAAYMSTLSTTFNWASSFLLNDLYKRFIKPAASERHYVNIARLCVVIAALAGVVATVYTQSIAGAWKYFSNLTVGAGAIYLLRWFWWRINAWSEISAMVVSLIVTNVIYLFNAQGVTHLEYPYSLAVTLLFSLPISLVITYLTAPVSDEKLVSFITKVRPPKTFWMPVYRKVPSLEGQRILASDVLLYIASVACIVAALIGTGELILGSTFTGLGLLLLAFLCGWLSIRILSARKTPSLTAQES
jgi:SSS family solute:Na+ symporter